MYIYSSEADIPLLNQVDKPVSQPDPSQPAPVSSNALLMLAGASGSSNPAPFDRQPLEAKIEDLKASLKRYQQKLFIATQHITGLLQGVAQKRQQLDDDNRILLESKAALEINTMRTTLEEDCNQLSQCLRAKKGENEKFQTKYNEKHMERVALCVRFMDMGISNPEQTATVTGLDTSLRSYYEIARRSQNSVNEVTMRLSNAQERLLAFNQTHPDKMDIGSLAQLIDATWGKIIIGQQELDVLYNALNNVGVEISQIKNDSDVLEKQLHLYEQQLHLSTRPPVPDFKL
jgi:hypothetical protein